MAGIEEREANLVSGAEKSVAAALDALYRVSNWLETCSSIIGIATVLNMFTLFLTSISLKLDMDRLFGNFGAYYSTILLATPLLWGCVVFMLNKFDRMTAKGNDLYQEISDSLEWEKSEKATLLSSRLRLKDFLRSASLPFFRRGRNGPLAYLIGNSFISFAQIYTIVWLVR